MEPEFGENSLAPRRHLLEEQRSHWRAEIQTIEKTRWFYLEEIACVEEAADVDTRWEAIWALTREAELRGRYALRTEERDLPRIVTGASAQEQVSRQNSRALQAGNESGLTAEQWESKVADYEGRCAYCGRRRTIILEHVIPVSRGGGTVFDNVLPSCRSCNTSKSDSDPVEWLAANPDRLFCLIDAICKAEGLLVA